MPCWYMHHPYRIDIVGNDVKLVYRKGCDRLIKNRQQKI